MRVLRQSQWFRAVGLLLLALLVPVQAAGCCKLGAFLWNPEAETETETETETAAATAEPVEGMAPDHSCCPKPQGNPPEGGPTAAADGAAPCEPGGTGCCLESTGPSEPGLAASLVQAPKFLSIILKQPLPGRLEIRGEHGRTSAIPPTADGPPLYLIHRSLLI